MEHVAGLILRQNRQIKFPFYCDVSEALYLWDDGVSEKPVNFYEICLWKKCPGLVKDLSNMVFGDTTAKVARVSEGDIKIIKETLSDWSDERFWSKYCNSIWTYNAYKYNLQRQRRNIRWLLTYIKANPDAEIYYYERDVENY